VKPISIYFYLFVAYITVQSVDHTMCLVVYTITLLYLICPDVLRVVGETSYGIWVGFIRSTNSLNKLFLYLFVFEM